MIINADKATEENLNLIEDFIKENLNKPIVIKQLLILAIKDATFTILTHTKDSATSELVLKPYDLNGNIKDSIIKLSFSHKIKKGSVTSDGKEYKAGHITTEITKATYTVKGKVENLKNFDDLIAMKIEHFINSNKDIKGIISTQRKW